MLNGEENSHLYKTVMSRILDPGTGFLKMPSSLTSTTIQRMTAKLSLLPGGPAGYAGASIPTLFTWNPLAAADGACVFVFMVTGTVVANNIAGVPAGTENWCFPTMTNANAAPMLLGGSTGVFIPLASSQNIIFSPSTTSTTAPLIPKDFAYGRINTGCFKLSAAETSITLASLTGTVTAGIGELRSMTGITDSNIKQNTVSQKDTVFMAKMEQGVVIIAGTDISPEFHQIADTLERAPVELSIQVAGSSNIPPGAAALASATYAAVDPLSCSPFLITPLDPTTNTTYLTNTSITGTAVIGIPPPSPFAPPEIELVISYTTAALTSPCVVPIIHYYVSATTAQAPFTPITTTRYTELINIGDNLQLTANATVPFSATPPSTTYTCRPPHIRGCLWVGAAGALIPPAAGETLSLLSVRIKTSRGEFATGPTRLALIQNISAGQQTLILGEETVEFVPTYSLAPYANSTPITRVSAAFLEKIKTVFEEPEAQPKRCFKLQDYYELLESFQEKRSIKRDRDQ